MMRQMLVPRDLSVTQGRAFTDPSGEPMDVGPCEEDGTCADAMQACLPGRSVSHNALMTPIATRMKL